MEMTSPLGILDSGVGGLSVFIELHRLLPKESTVYYADSKNCPYGGRDPSEIEDLTNRIIRFLYLEKKCKLILIACNTITSTLINKFRDKYPIPFVGIEPATKVAVKNTSSGRIGILATKGTFTGELFNQTKSRYGKGIKFFNQIGRGLVELVEKGELDSQLTRSTLKKYIDPLNQEDIDQLVLGCTHYPFLKKSISALLNKNVNIIDPAPAVARQVLSLLSQQKLLNPGQNPPTNRFYTSGNAFPLKTLLPDIDMGRFIVKTDHQITKTGSQRT